MIVPVRAFAREKDADEEAWDEEEDEALDESDDFEEYSGDE